MRADDTTTVVPAGMRVFRFSGDLGWIIGRTLCRSEADLENVRAEKMDDSFPNKNVTDREDFAAHQSDGGRADGGRAALRQNAKPVAA